MNNKSFILSDLSFGDCGKGSITDFLCRKYNINLVVRFGGSGNCAHNVVEPSGRHHEFSQFGSGTLIPGNKTLLSRHVLVEPLALQNEEIHLQEIGIKDAYSRLFIDGSCRIITPFDIIVSAIREEQRGNNPHGSAQSGIGERMARSFDPFSDTMYFYDFSGSVKSIKRKLEDVQSYFILNGFSNYQDRLDIDLEKTAVRYKQVFDSVGVLDTRQADIIIRDNRAVFEGHQGVLLDQDFGFHPHTTWSTTTKSNTVSLLEAAGVEEKPVVLGLTRAYGHRHGAGPFPTHDTYLDFLEEPHNSDFSGQGKFRKGWLDLNLLKYAITANGGVDYLAISHVDVLSKLEEWKICTSYANGSLVIPKTIAEQENNTRTLSGIKPCYNYVKSGNVVDFLQDKLSTRVVIQSFGKTANDKIMTERF